MGILCDSCHKSIEDGEIAAVIFRGEVIGDEIEPLENLLQICWPCHEKSIEKNGKYLKFVSLN